LGALKKSEVGTRRRFARLHSALRTALDRVDQRPIPYPVSLTSGQVHAPFYDATTHLSGLVDRAAAREEMVAKNGVAQARLVSLASLRIAADFDARDPHLARGRFAT
jgi:antitoxin (DNA-binding transcriptional repressor) of toxin-antitoxin stability system